MDVGVGRTEHSPPSVGLSNWISQCVKRASMGVNQRPVVDPRGIWVSANTWVAPIALIAVWCDGI
jgi:hypothetical protein